MFGGFYTPSQYQYGIWVKIQLTLSKGHFLNLDLGSGQVCILNENDTIFKPLPFAFDKCCTTANEISY